MRPPFASSIHSSVSLYFHDMRSPRSDLLFRCAVLAFSTTLLASEQSFPSAALASVGFIVRAVGVDPLLLLLISVAPQDILLHQRLERRSDVIRAEAAVSLAVKLAKNVTGGPLLIEEAGLAQLDQAGRWRYAGAPAWLVTAATVHRVVGVVRLIDNSVAVRGTA